MATRTTWVAIALALVTAVAIGCDKKKAAGDVEEAPASAGTTAAEKPADTPPADEAGPSGEKAEIPQQYKNAAADEITADNAEQAAADLEKQIDSEM